MIGPMPAFIGPANAWWFTGRSPRWVKDFAAKHGIAILRPGDKRAWLIPARPLIEAIERHAVVESESTTAPIDDVTDLEQLRAALGKQRRRDR